MRHSIVEWSLGWHRVVTSHKTRDFKSHFIVNHFVKHNHIIKPGVNSTRFYERINCLDNYYLEKCWLLLRFVRIHTSWLCKQNCLYLSRLPFSDVTLVVKRCPESVAFCRQTWWSNGNKWFVSCLLMSSSLLLFLDTQAFSGEIIHLQFCWCVCSARSGSGPLFSWNRNYSWHIWRRGWETSRVVKTVAVGSECIRGCNCF